MTMPEIVWPKHVPVLADFLSVDHYADPHLLWAVAAIAVAGVLISLWMSISFYIRLRRFVAVRLRTSEYLGHPLLHRQIKFWAMALAAIALALTVARPQGSAQPQTASRKGVNIVIAVDGSRSMMAEDVKPNRFGFAQAGIDSLLDAMRGDRAALMLFAGQTTLVAPLSFDSVSLQVVNKGLDPELSGKGGSSLAAVIVRGTEYLSRRPYPAKAIILFTDGGETEGDLAVAAQEAYQKHGVRVFTVGVGTAQGGPIPHFERDIQRRRVRLGPVRDTDGQIVQSRLEERALTMAAAVGGGKYVDLLAVKGDLRAFYREALKPLAAPMEDVPLPDVREWYQWPLALALLLLLLELVWSTGRGRRLPGAAAALLVSVAVAMSVPETQAADLKPATRASTAQVQQLLAGGKAGEAWELLQQARLAAPDDPLARYNYAVGAYAAGKYTVAIDTLEKLTDTVDIDVQARAPGQLGNSFYRLGEAMRAKNPEGTIAQWTKALSAYERAGPDAMSMHNAAKVRRDLVDLLLKLAGTRERAGDAEARISPERGIPAWRESIGYLDQAMKTVQDETQAKRPAAIKERVSGKIFDAYFSSAQDKQRQAQNQKNAALEMAIEQAESALSDYDAALAIRPNSTPARAGRDEVIKALNPWVIELADREHQEGEKLRSGFLQNAITIWQQAAGRYSKVLERTPGHAAAERGQKINNRSLHDGYVELGDQEQKQADNPSMRPQERDALYDSALSRYQTALNLEPDNAKTKQKLEQLGRKLVTRFVARGEGELKQGQELAKPKPPEAIAWLERSVQSFSKALAFDEKNPAALGGKKTAEDLLRQLRNLDAENQRKILANSKKLQNAEEMKEKSRQALKLLDYNTDKLASKKQQDYILPENKPVKDW